MKATPEVIKHFTTNFLTTLRTIARFGNRDIDTILQDFPPSIITTSDFVKFSMTLHHLASFLKDLGEQEKGKDSAINTPNPDSYLEYLPDNDDETNEFCLTINEKDLQRSARRSARTFQTELQKAIEKVIAATDPIIGSTISTPSRSSRGGSTISSKSSSKTSTSSKSSHSSRHSKSTKSRNNKAHQPNQKANKKNTAAKSNRTAKTIVENSMKKTDVSDPDLEDAIRSGENKFAGLPTIAESDPEDYIHPNHWKTINTYNVPAKARMEVAKRHVLPTRVQWRGEVSNFLDYKDEVIGHFMQVSAGYLFDQEFQDLWKEHKYDALKYSQETEFITRSQLKVDIQSLYGALKSSLKNRAGTKHLLHYEKEEDGLSVWMDLVEEFDKDGDKDLRISKLELQRWPHPVCH